MGESVSTITSRSNVADIDRHRATKPSLHPAGASIVRAGSMALSVAEAVLIADRTSTSSSEVSVHGEVKGLHHSPSGHLHFTLCGDRTGLRVCAAGLDDQLLSPPLPPGAGLAEGQVVRVRGRLMCQSDRRIVKLRATSVELAVGGAASAEAALYGRQLLVDSLGAEGLLLAQRRLALPPVPQQIWLVGTEGEQMDDFISVLDDSPWAWDVLYAPAPPYGPEAVQAVSSAISAAPAAADVIIILQQHGWGAWLLYDSEPVARAICNARSPVVTAGGHVGNRSVADECAWAAVSTPVAAAELLCRQTAVSSDRIAEKHRSVLHSAEVWVSRSQTELDARMTDIHEAAMEALDRCRRAKEDATARRGRLLIALVVLFVLGLAALGLFKGVLQ
jgi:exodeoxyribonuclease VII large subunit